MRLSQSIACKLNTVPLPCLRGSSRTISPVAPQLIVSALFGVPAIWVGAAVRHPFSRRRLLCTKSSLVLSDCMTSQVFRSIDSQCVVGFPKDNKEAYDRGLVTGAPPGPLVL